jgi:peroxiredoxin
MRVWIAVVAVAGCVLWDSGAKAQSFTAFDPRPHTDLTVPAFADRDITGLVGALDHLLAKDADALAWRVTAADALWQFARRLQAGRLSPAPETTVLSHLDQIAKSRSDAPAVVAAARHMVKQLMVGKVAPDIVGTDLDGRSFKLSEYRDKVVVLSFSAEWCGICRSQAPYERFLLDRYARWPLALLGVQTGTSRETARQAQATDPLVHRAWWDAPRRGETRGPIASAWNVIGWPASYVIDGEGIIRFVDLRDEDLLKAVRQLTDAQLDRDAKAKRVR